MQRRDVGVGGCSAAAAMSIFFSAKRNSRRSFSIISASTPSAEA